MTARSASDSPSYSVERRVGRLIEARVFHLRTPDDANRYSMALGTEVARVPSDTQPVLCADHRPVLIYSQAVADRLTQLFLQMNSRLERIAILVAPTNATLSLQLYRIVREAGYEHRRVFQIGTDAVAHLAPILDTAELGRVRDFVAEFAGPR